MAVTVLTNDPDVFLNDITLCEDATGWTGSSPAQYTEIFLQGSACVSLICRAAGVHEQTYTPASAINFTDPHLRMRILSTVGPALKTKANGGIAFWASDGTNKGYWVVGGSDTYAGGWGNFVADMSAPVNLGTAPNLSAITSLGVRFDKKWATSNVVNFFVDCVRFGNGITAYGDNGGSAFNLDDIIAIAESTANKYGIVDKDTVTGLYVFHGALKLGTSANLASFAQLSSILAFADIEASNTLFKILGAGTSDIDFTGTFITSAATRWTFDLDDSSLVSVILDGATIQKTLYFRGGAAVSADGTVFDDCNMLNPNSTQLNNFVVKNGAGAYGLYWPVSPNISNGQFIDNDRAVAHTVAGDVTYDNLTFSGNTYQAEYSGTGTLNIYTQNGGNVSQSEVLASGGGTINVYNQRYKAFSGLPENTEVRIRQGSYTLAHEQDVTGGTYTFYYDPDNDKPARAQFTLPGYVFEPIDIYLDSNDQTFPVTVKPDPSYIT